MIGTMGYVGYLVYMLVVFAFMPIGESSSVGNLQSFFLNAVALLVEPVSKF